MEFRAESAPHVGDDYADALLVEGKHAGQDRAEEVWRLARCPDGQVAGVAIVARAGRAPLHRRRCLPRHR